MSKVLPWSEVFRRKACGEEVARSLQESLIIKGRGMVRGPVARLQDARRLLLDAGHPPDQVVLCALGFDAMLAVGPNLSIFSKIVGLAEEKNPFLADEDRYQDVGIRGIVPYGGIRWVHGGTDYDPV